MKSTTLSWLKYGLTGGVALSALVVFKLLRFIASLGTGSVPEMTALEIVQFGGFLFATGFVSGVVYWAIQSFVRGPRWIADALTGLIILEVVFVACSIMFEPTALTTHFAQQGMPMFLLAAVVGPIVGVKIGRDTRKELSR